MTQFLIDITSKPGGFAGIISLVSIIIKYFTDKILQKQKTRDDRSIYVSKVKFDKEFSIYSELCESFFELVSQVSELFPVGIRYESTDPNEKLEQQKTECRKAVNKYNNANAILGKNNAFIPEDIYTIFRDLLNGCREQISIFQHFVIREGSRGLSEYYEKTEEIFIKLENINAKIRDYISKLEVIDEK